MMAVLLLGSGAGMRTEAAMTSDYSASGSVILAGAGFGVLALVTAALALRNRQRNKQLAARLLAKS